MMMLPFLQASTGSAFQKLSYAFEYWRRPMRRHPGSLRNPREPWLEKACLSWTGCTTSCLLLRQGAGPLLKWGSCDLLLEKMGQRISLWSAPGEKGKGGWEGIFSFYDTPWRREILMSMVCLGGQVKGRQEKSDRDSAFCFWGWELSKLVMKDGLSSLWLCSYSKAASGAQDKKPNT